VKEKSMEALSACVFGKNIAKSIDIIIELFI
jgi:hypothetical protein